VDHIRPLKRGGADAPRNVPSETTAAAKAKDWVEEAARTAGAGAKTYFASAWTLVVLQLSGRPMGRLGGTTDSSTHVRSRRAARKQ
jgi:hypothetical protein